MKWDPEIDSPATIIVIGGGPVGIEAALYARFLGYSVLLLEAGRIGECYALGSDYILPGSWNESASPLGLAALEAQGSPLQQASDVQVTRREFVDSYLLPVARTDLLRESIQVNSVVQSISRQCCGINTPAPELRSELEFRVLIDSKQRGEYSQLADIILDCSGCSTYRPGMATGGGLAIGERSEGGLLHSGPLSFERNRSDFASKHTLVWGNGFDAAYTVLELKQLSAEQPETKFTWILPKRLGKTNSRLDIGDRSPTFTSAVEAILNEDNPNGVCLDAWGIEALSHDGSEWKLRLQTQQEETLDVTVDQFINCSKPYPDWSFCHGISAATPIPANDSPLDSPCATHEPHYYVLGDKAACDLNLTEARNQIREIFGLIGGRKELDLYLTVRPQSDQ